MEGIIEFGNYHFTTIAEIINSDRKHQWILKLVGESEIRTEIFTHLKAAPHKLSKHKEGEKGEK